MHFSFRPLEGRRAPLSSGYFSTRYGFMPVINHYNLKAWHRYVHVQPHQLFSLFWHSLCQISARDAETRKNFDIWRRVCVCVQLLNDMRGPSMTEWPTPPPACRVSGGDSSDWKASEGEWEWTEWDDEEEEEEEGRGGRTHLRDFHLSFSMLFSGPSLSYEARKRAATQKEKTSVFLQNKIIFNSLIQCLILKGACFVSIWFIIELEGTENARTDRPPRPPERSAGAAGSCGPSQTDTPPASSSGTRSPVWPIPRISETQKQSCSGWISFFK